jgi:iron complex transport system permease protein
MKSKMMAATNLLIFNASDRGAEAALFWMLGSFGSARWNVLAPAIIAFLIGAAWVMCRARGLDALSIGDEGAHTLGINVKALRLEMFIATALMTGVFVSTSGAVGFVGLNHSPLRPMDGGRENRKVRPDCRGDGGDIHSVG